MNNHQNNETVRGRNASETNQGHNGSSDDLLVDFPSSGRQSFLESVRARTQTAPTTHRVCFSEQSYLSFHRFSGHDLRQAWISPSDKERIRNEQLEGRRTLQQFLRSDPSRFITRDELMLIVGYESVASRALMRRAYERRARHSRAVLAEQARQRAENVQDLEAMRRVAERHSRHDGLKAHRIAMAYSRDDDGSYDLGEILEIIHE